HRPRPPRPDAGPRRLRLAGVARGAARQGLPATAKGGDVSDRSEARLKLGAAAVFSEAEAIRLLPCRDSTARGWLREHGIGQEHPQLGRIVLWGSVLALLEHGEGPSDPAPSPPARTSTLPRGGLRRR